VRTSYFESGDSQGQTVAVFRLREDPEGQQLWLERLTPDGEWVDDPSLLDELHEAGVKPIDPDQARAVEDSITSSSPRAA